MFDVNWSEGSQTRPGLTLSTVHCHSFQETGKQLFQERGDSGVNFSRTTRTCANLWALRPFRFFTVPAREAAVMFVDNTSRLPLEADKRPTTEPAHRRESAGAEGG